MILHAFTDGASRGNPGESGIGIVVRTEGGETVLAESAYIGRTTNNVAEYLAL
ncbi:MAG TPA: RNase H family protein, partial [Bacteroidota bacterium]